MKITGIDIMVVKINSTVFTLKNVTAKYRET